MYKKILSFIFISLISFSSFANMDGNELYQYGQQSSNPNPNPTQYSQVGFYMGYISGVLENDSGRNGYFCIPLDVKKMDVFAVVFKYLKDNPKLRDQDASLLIITSVKSTWPCQQQK